MQIMYKQKLVADSRRKGEAYERGQPEIDVRGRRIFVGSSDYGLYAINAVNGQRLWRFETVGAVQCEPLYVEDEDVLYFGSNDGALYKVRARDGRLLWRFMTNAEVSVRPVLSGGVLYAVNANDTLLALNPKTGKVLWSQHRAPAFGMEVAGHAAPLVSGGLVYLAFSDGTVTAFDAKTGEERWQPVDLSAEAEQTLGEIPQYLDVDTTPIAHELETGAAIFVGSYEGGVFALDAQTGTQLWANTGVRGVTDLLLWTQPEHPARKGDGPPLPAREVLVASTGTTGLWGLDPQTGEQLWRRDLPEGGVTRPVPVAGALLLGTSKHGLFLVAPLDGGVIDGLDLGAGFYMTPAAHGRRAFAVSNQGNLWGIHVSPPL